MHGWRDRIAPATVGLPAGGVRRAAGLRREELAQLAGLSVDYITRLEQGRATSPSAQVLSALARALRLSAAERAYLYLLAGAATARYPADAGLRSLIKDLRGVSTAFARLWDTGIVGVHESDTKAVHHPDLGTFTFDCDVLIAPGSDLRIVAYTAAPGSDAAGRLRLLNVIGTQAMAEDSTPG